jgi:hypothetical protein
MGVWASKSFPEAIHSLHTKGNEFVSIQNEIRNEIRTTWSSKLQVRSIYGPNLMTSSTRTEDV